MRHSPLLTLSAGLLTTTALHAQALTLESANGAGLPVGSSHAGISDDGRFVVLMTDSPLMLSGDPAYFIDAFVRDRSTGAVELASPSVSGGFANESVNAVALSADGNFVVFMGFASNHVVGDTNGVFDVFVADRSALPALERVSVSSSGAQANGASSQPAISGDGRFVAFTSVATNLVPGDTAGWQDVFVRDRQTSTTIRVSQTALGLDGDSFSGRPALSSDGRFVVFETSAANLVLPDANGHGQDIVLFDLASAALERVSFGAGGVQGSASCQYASLSADGRFVVYSTAAPELTGVPNTGFQQIVLHDRTLVSNELVSVTNAGQPANGTCVPSFVSENGDRVLFGSQANNLGGTGSFTTDVFLRERSSQTTMLESVDVNGQALAVDSTPLGLSADGARLLMWSNGALVPPDTNAVPDTFLLDLQASTPQLTIYCTAKTSSAGCVPRIGVNGIPHAGGNDAFFVFCRIVLAQKSGIFFWSRQATATPFGGGTLCVKPPTTRTPVQSSGGFTGCSGNFSFHFTQAYMAQSNVLAGDTLYGQFWYRDPGFAPPNNIGLSDALAFVVEP